MEEIDGPVAPRFFFSISYFSIKEDESIRDVIFALAPSGSSIAAIRAEIDFFPSFAPVHPYPSLRYCLFNFTTNDC